MNYGDDALSFYAQLGDQYDEMTQHAKRLESLGPAMTSLAERLQFRHTLDLGCGSGAHAIALTQAGVKVTPIDPSSEMIDLANKNAQAAGVEIVFQATTIDTLLPQHKSAFDSAICLGNTLPHLLDEKQLRGTLAAARELLAPGGHLILQLLNYDRILARSERIVGVRKAGGRTFIRFYDFNEPLIRFNILILVDSGDKPGHRLISTELYPWRREELFSLLTSLQFTDLAAAADLQASPFDHESSTDLVISARR